MPWRYVSYRGDIRVGFVTKGGVTRKVLDTRYGTIQRAKEAAAAMNEKGVKPDVQ